MQFFNRFAFCSIGGTELRLLLTAKWMCFWFSFSCSI